MRAYIVATVATLLCVGAHLCANGQEIPAATNKEPASEAEPSRIVIIQRQEEAKPLPREDRMLTEEEAYDLVWNLPEVKKEIERILDKGGIPLSTVGARPSPDCRPKGANSFYIIRFQSVHAKDVLVDLLFSVDAFTGEASVYDAPAGAFISLDEWRGRHSSLN